MTGEAVVRAAQPSCAEFALDKLTRVFGDERARRIYEHTMILTGLTTLRTADELYAFAQQLSRSGGFEAAVGGLLSVAAILRGAAGDRG